MGERQFVVALTTAGSDAQAESIARALVERRQAACVNIVGGVCSVYRWQGKVEREEEKLLVIKTAADRIEAVRTTIHELHTYDLPELIVLPLQGGDPSYLGWLADELEPSRG